MTTIDKIKLLCLYIHVAAVDHILIMDFPVDNEDYYLNFDKMEALSKYIIRDNYFLDRTIRYLEE